MCSIHPSDSQLSETSHWRCYSAGESCPDTSGLFWRRVNLSIDTGFAVLRCGMIKIVSNQLKPFPCSYAGHRWLALLGGCAGAGCCRPVTRAHHAICGCALHPGIFHHSDPSKDCPRCDIRKPMNLKISNIQGHILYASKQTTSLQWNGVWGKLLKWHYLATWYHAATVAYDDAQILGHRVFFCVATRHSWSVFVLWYYVQVGVDSRRCCTASMATDSQGHPS